MSIDICTVGLPFQINSLVALLSGQNYHKIKCVKLVMLNISSNLEIY